MTNLRSVKPIGITHLTPNSPSTGVSMFESVEPKALSVDPA